MLEFPKLEKKHHKRGQNLDGTIRTSQVKKGRRRKKDNDLVYFTDFAYSHQRTHKRAYKSKKK